MVVGTRTPTPRVFYGFNLASNTVQVNVPASQTFYLRSLTINPPAITLPEISPGTVVQNTQNPRAAITLNGSALHQFVGVFHRTIGANHLVIGTSNGSNAAGYSSAFAAMSPVTQALEMDLDGPAAYTFAITSGYTGSVSGYLGEPYMPEGWSVVASTPAPTPIPTATPAPTLAPSSPPSTPVPVTPAPSTVPDSVASSTFAGLTAESAAGLMGGINRVLDAALLVVGFGFLTRVWWRLSRGSI